MTLHKNTKDTIFIGSDLNSRKCEIHLLKIFEYYYWKIPPFKNNLKPVLEQWFFIHCTKGSNFKIAMQNHQQMNPFAFTTSWFTNSSHKHCGWAYVPGGCWSGEEWVADYFYVTPGRTSLISNVWSCSYIPSGWYRWDTAQEQNSSVEIWGSSLLWQKCFPKFIISYVLYIISRRPKLWNSLHFCILFSVLLSCFSVSHFWPAVPFLVLVHRVPPLAVVVVVWGE